MSANPVPKNNMLIEAYKEEELDVKLFHRSTKSVGLTPAGIIFLNDAKEILAKLELTTQKIKTHSETSIQLLSIGCSNGTDSFLLSKLLSQCREQLPEIHPLPQMLYADKALAYIPLIPEITLSYGIFYKKNVSNPVLKKFLSF